MQGYIDSIIVLLLLITGWQDFSSRSVSPWPLVTVFALLVYRAIEILGLQTALLASATNFLLLFIEILFIFIYIKLKKGKNEPVMDKYLGWGDVLFFAAIVPAFFPLSFMIFLLSSLLIVIITYLFLVAFKINHNRLIPLAGILSVFFASVLLIENTTGIHLTYETSFSLSNSPLNNDYSSYQK